MKRIVPLILVLTVILAACTTSPSLSETAAPTSAPENTAANVPVSTPTPEMTFLPTDASPAPTEEPPALGPVTFHIIPEESTVTYEVGETFFNQNNRFNLAVGITKTITGQIFGDLSNPPASSIGPIQVDISQFISDSSRRDNAIRRDWLESSNFPIATFESTQIEGLPTSYVEGQDYPLKVTGNLTVRDATRQIVFEVTTRLEGSTLTGRAETTILLSDFNIGPISIAGVLKTEDQAHLILEFVARP